ncbi:MAG: lipopolysaccharide biosynthesis protein [Thiohalocapsa sp.]
MSLAVTPQQSAKSRLLQKLGRFRYGISALDQIALSLFGFALNLCLVRALSATEFGVVSLWMAMAALATSVQAALTSGPLNIHLPAAPDQLRARRLEAAVAVVNLLAVLLAAATGGLLILLADAEWAPADILTGAAIPLFLAAGMSREFSRTVAFSRRSMKMLLWIDLPYLAVTSLGLAAMFAWPERCATVAGAFIVMSVGAIVSQVGLRLRFRMPRAWPFEPGALEEYRRIGRDIVWAMVGVVAGHLQTRSYIYVTVNLVSLAGLAAINVVGILFRRARLLLQAWMRWVLPAMSGHLAHGRVRAFDRLFLQGFGAAAVGSALWFAALWLAWPVIERHFLAGRYPDAWTLMLPWAIAAGLDAMAFTVSVALQSAREFKFLALVTMVAAPITLLATTGAVLWRGYTWTMVGVALGELATLAMYLARLYLTRRKVLAQNGGANEIGPANAGLDRSAGD